MRILELPPGEDRDLGDGWNPKVSANGRWLSYVDRSEEADVWMATLESGDASVRTSPP